MRFGAKGGGLPAAVFNMRRTDAAGIALLVAAVLLALVAISALRE